MTRYQLTQTLTIQSDDTAKINSGINNVLDVLNSAQTEARAVADTAHELASMSSELQAAVAAFQH